MKRLFAAIVCGLALAGCSTVTTPVPSQTPVTTPPTTPVTPSRSATSSPSASPTPTKPKVDIPAGACLTPTAAVMTWVQTLVSDTTYPASKVAMVDAGPGNRADETWDIVAFPMTDTSTGQAVTESYLTNANSTSQPSGSLWINIGTSDDPSWDSVSWTSTRLAAGQQAQQIAFACLGPQ